MLENGWDDKQIVNKKHLGRPATDMVILARPELGDINKAQRNTIPHYDSPLHSTVLRKDICA